MPPRRRGGLPADLDDQMAVGVDGGVGEIRGVELVLPRGLPPPAALRGPGLHRFGDIGEVGLPQQDRATGSRRRIHRIRGHRVGRRHDHWLSRAAEDALSHLAPPILDAFGQRELHADPGHDGLEEVADRHRFGRCRGRCRRRRAHLRRAHRRDRGHVGLFDRVGDRDLAAPLRARRAGLGEGATPVDIYRAGRPHVRGRRHGIRRVTGGRGLLRRDHVHRDRAGSGRGDLGGARTTSTCDGPPDFSW